MTRKELRPAKNARIIAHAREAVAGNRVVLSAHAEERMHERDITVDDVKKVLGDGIRDVRKDDYVERYRTWKYCFTGRDERRRTLEIIISELGAGILLITAIHKERK